MREVCRLMAHASALQSYLPVQILVDDVLRDADVLAETLARDNPLL